MIDFDPKIAYTYFKVSFPLTKDPAESDRLGFASCEPIEFEGTRPAVGDGFFPITSWGRVYLAHNFGILYSRNKDYVNNLKKMSVDQLVDEINLLAERKGKEKQRKDLTLVLADGKIVGLMKTYIPKSNAEIASMIRLNGLAERVVFVANELNSYRVGILSTLKGGRVGLSIENGCTGYVAFGYRSFIRVGDINLTVKERNRMRHIGSVREVFSDLDAIVNECGALEVENWLGGRNGEWLYKKWTEWMLAGDASAKKVLERLKEPEGKKWYDTTASELVDLVGEVSVRGLRIPARNLLQKTVDMAVEVLNTKEEKETELKAMATIIDKTNAEAETMVELPPVEVKRGRGRPKKVVRVETQPEDMEFVDQEEFLAV